MLANPVLRIEVSTLIRQGNDTDFRPFQVTSSVTKISEAEENLLPLIETKSIELTRLIGQAQIFSVYLVTSKGRHAYRS